MSELCVACRSEPTAVVLLPCNHKELCKDCALQLSSPICPLCRRESPRAKFLLKAGVREVDFSDLIQEKERKDEQVFANTIQVVVVGPRKVGKKDLRKKIVSRFPCTPSNESSHYRDELEVVSRFEPNSNVGGIDICFRTFDLPPLNDIEPVAISHLLWNLEDMRPDVLVLACSMHLLKSFNQMVKWDSYIRARAKARGEELPQRIWILLRAPGFDPLSPSAVDLRVDIYEGMADIAIPDRPCRHYVVAPKAWIPRAVGKLARQCARFGAEARGMDAPQKTVFHRVLKRMISFKT